MRPQDAEEFTLALARIVIGAERQIALAKRVGVPQALGLSVDEWIRQRLSVDLVASVLPGLASISGPATEYDEAAP